MVKILALQKGKLRESANMESFKKEPEEGLLWLDYFQETGEEEGKEEGLERISSVLRFHPVTREVLERPSNRPRLVDYGRYFSLTIHVPGGHLHEPLSHEIDIVVGEHWIVTVHEKKIKGIVDLEEICRKRPEIMSQGSDYFLQELLEQILERFFPLLDWFDESIGRLEDRVSGDASDASVKRIVELRRAVAGVRRTMQNQREVIARLARGEMKLIRMLNLPYYRDLYEELMRVADSVDDARERLILLREMHMNQTSNRLNQVMKVLTVWATIFLPLTFLAGVWGMNFRFMPELSKPWGYWAALGVMAAVAAGLVIYFRRKRWL